MQKNAEINFSVSIKTPKGERGLRVKAQDALAATKQAISRLAIRDNEIPPGGLELRVRASA